MFKDLFCADQWTRGMGAGRYLGQAARLMVGIPDYENYVAHMRAAHPDQPVMGYDAFFRDRQQARYGKGRSGGCC